METSTKRGRPSYSVGNIQPDKYKRKALDVPTCRCQSKHEVDHHCSKNRGNTLPGRGLLQFVDSPPKKQRLATTLTSDGYCSVCKIQHAIRSAGGSLGRYYNSDGRASESSQYSESTASTGVDSDYGETSLTYDSNSSRSSRSSPRPPELERQVSYAINEFSESASSGKSHSIYNTMERALAADLVGIWASSPSSSFAERMLAKESAYSFVDETAMTPSAASNDQSSGESEPVDDGQSFQQNDNIDQSSSFTAPASPSNRSHQATPSTSETESPLTEGGGSSHSQPSSGMSDSDNVDGNGEENEANGTLYAVIKRALNDPEVAKILYLRLYGRLECAPPQQLDYLFSDLSLLSFLDVQDSALGSGEGSFTTCAPSSNSGTLYQGGAISSSSQSEEIRAGAGQSGRNPAKTPGGSPSQLIKPQKKTSRSSSSSGKSYLLRCFHNALAPDMFCVTHETQERFRACAGPGWNSIAHLKEHMRSHHTIKPNLLQCTRCQEEFDSQELLREHEKNVDCIIRCPDCAEEFEKKALRQTHQEATHMDRRSASIYLEIDEAKDQKIKESLKRYSDSLRKGKGPLDTEIEKWIEANTARYLIGRSAKDPRMELGQWYTIFTTLFSGTIVDHPFYDFGLPSSDLVAENILLINKEMIDVRVQVYGPPPTEQSAQQEWYQDVLRDTLKVAAGTKLVLPSTSPQSLEQQDINNAVMASSYSQTTMTRAKSTPGAGYNVATIATPHQLPEAAESAPPQHISPSPVHEALHMSRHVPSNFLRDDQNQFGMMTVLPNSPADVTSTPNRILATQMGQQWGGYSQQAQDDMRHTVVYEQQYNDFDDLQRYHVDDFDPQGSEMLGHSQQYPWMPPGRR